MVNALYEIEQCIDALQPHKHYPDVARLLKHLETARILILDRVRPRA